MLPVLAWLISLTIGSADPVTIELVGGSTIRGEVLSASAEELVVDAEFGSVRIPIERVSTESRARLGLRAPSAAEVERLRNEVRELKALAARLEGENAQLRRDLLAARTESARQHAQRQSFTQERMGLVSRSKESATNSHWITTSSRKRHNSSCRWYRQSQGRPCGPNEGVACKVCGG